MVRSDVWVEVDLSALKHNLEQIRKLVGDGVKITAVVKANGYGHGYVQPSKAFIEAGADALAVTRLDEAILLRDGGLKARILVLAPIQAANAALAVEADLDLTLTSLPLAHSISQAAHKVGKPAAVHIKVDTGMGRLGVPPSDALDFVQAVSEMPWLHIAGIYTHFAAAADADLGATQRQLALFENLLSTLRRHKLAYGLAHAANSAAVVRLPQSHLDMVRPGTILFGQYPSEHVPRTLDLRSAFKLKARICEMRNLPAGATVGYASEFKTKRPTKTAVIPVGWADGFTLIPEGPVYRQGLLRFAAKKMARRLFAEVHGRKVPIIGRVGMQTCIVDVTDVPGIQVGDEATLPAMRIPVSAVVPRVYT